MSSRSLRHLAADDADRQAGPREGLAPDHPLRQPQLGADRPHLVLKQHPQRLDQLEVEVLGQAADVVVGLDRRGPVAAARLDHVGVERALHQVADALQPRRLLLEDADELLADDLALAARGPRRRRAWRGSALRRRRERAGCRIRRMPPRPARPRSCASGRGRRRRRSACSPTALWTSSAATEESTPPESPQITRPSPTWCPDPRHLLGDHRLRASTAARSPRHREGSG